MKFGVSGGWKGKLFKLSQVWGSRPGVGLLFSLLHVCQVSIDPIFGHCLTLLTGSVRGCHHTIGRPDLHLAQETVVLNHLGDIPRLPLLAHTSHGGSIRGWVFGCGENQITSCHQDADCLNSPLIYPLRPLGVPLQHLGGAYRRSFLDDLIFLSISRQRGVSSGHIGGCP